MTGRKRLKLTVLWIARSCSLFALARLLTARTVKSLGYHYVSMEDEETRFPSLFLTQEQLRARLAHLTNHYRIVTLDEAVTALRESTPGRGRVALTFDDGLYNFAAAAVPVLSEFGAPATVYVVTAHVANDVPFCSLLLRDILLRSRAARLCKPILDIGPCDITSPADRSAFEKRVTEHMTSLPHASPERLAFTTEVGDALGVDVEGLLERRIWDVLHPDELRALSDQGFSVQVHGHNHLNVVEHVDDVFREVSTCARLISGSTGREARDYCYPFGLWCRATWPALEQAGMRSATTTLYGTNSPRTPMLSLRRYMDGGNLTQLEFEFELSGLRWLLWSLRNRAKRWEPAEKLVKYTESGQLY